MKGSKSAMVAHLVAMKKKGMLKSGGHDSRKMAKNGKMARTLSSSCK